MKKFGLAGLALVTAFAFTATGCKTGTYKVYSVTDGDTEYVCSKTDDRLAKLACSTYDVEFVLKAGGKYSTKSGNDEHTGLYKIEDGKLYVRDSKDADWKDTGATYKSGKITLDYGSWKVVYKK